jgi:hypothetical protein
MEFSFNPPPFGLIPASVTLDYNPYHQIGVDYATVLFNFNIRVEFAVNLTGDLDGDDGSVYNPFGAWSLGFDRDLFWGINLNVQCNENVRLFHDKINDNPLLDVEAGTDITSTRLTIKLAKTFLRDELEISARGIYDIENAGFLIMPAIVWTKNDVKTEFSGGIFGGDETSELGQYHKNGFIKVGVTYTF